MTNYGDTRYAVCIMGTPRSGSSLTARVLNILGLYIGGEDDLKAPGPGNPTGFWEAHRLEQLNHEIFQQMGITNADAPSLPSGWENSEELADERNDASAAIGELFGGHEVWGWKDPRNSLTLPLWRQVVACPLRHVICVRNPLDMAASGVAFATEHGGSINPATAYALWECYIANAIAHSAGEPRLFVAYESYFQDWKASANRLARFAGLGSPVATAKEDEIRSFLDDRLRHHSTPLTETLAHPELPDGVRSLYGALQRHLDDSGDPEVSAGGPELDAMAQEILSAGRG